MDDSVRYARYRVSHGGKEWFINVSMDVYLDGTSSEQDAFIDELIERKINEGKKYLGMGYSLDPYECLESMLKEEFDEVEMVERHYTFRPNIKR